MSGGSKVSGEVFLGSVRAVVDTGSAGLAVGRNVWRRDGPEALLDALEDVIYGGQPVESALS